MFTTLLDNLSEVYEGDIYLPESLRPFLEPFLVIQVKRQAQGKAIAGLPSFQNKPASQNPRFQASEKEGSYYWNDRQVRFYCESKLTEAFKSCPVPHIPDNIVETQFIIEFSLLAPEEKINGPVQTVQTKKGW